MEAVSLDPAKVKAEARVDGKYVLRTNTELTAAEVAVQYQRLLLVEQFFRAAKGGGHGGPPHRTVLFYG